MSGRASKRTLALVRVMLHIFSNPSWRDASLLPNSVEFSRWLTGAANPFMCPPHLLVKGVLLMLRKMVLLCGALLVGVIVLSGVALAKDIRGTFKQDDLRGTNLRDRIYGLARADTLGARAGNDDCYGGSGFDVIRCGDGNDRIDGGFGEDELFGGPANDTILAADGQVDYVNCGLGDNDTAYVDVIDEVDPAQATICEHIFEATEVTTSTEVTTPAEEVTTPPSP
jgi:hypothetical protein